MTTFNVYRRESNDTNPPVAIATGLTSMSYSDDTVEVGKTYLYSVGAEKNGFEKISSEKLVSAGGDQYWNDVVCLLSFDGNVLDKKGNVWSNSNGVYGEGRFDQGFVMNGSAVRTATLPYSSSLNFSNTSFTIDFWYKHQRASTWSAVLAQRERTQDSCFSIGLAGGSDYFYFEAPQLSPASIGMQMVVGVWALVSFEVDIEAKKLRAYKNGVLNAEVGFSGNVRQLNIPLRVGSLDSGRNPGTGTIDELRITRAARYKGVSFTLPDEPFPSF